MRTVRLLPLAAFLVFAGCAGARLDLAPMPQRDADLYPWAVEKSGVVVAVDEIADPERMQQYFGVNLLEHGVLPVNVIVSNRSDRRITLGPADVLLVQDRQVIDPLPIARVARIVEREGDVDDGASDLGDHFASLALGQETLEPNESYQGVLFFPRTQTERTRDGYPLRSILRLFGGELRINVGVTDTSTGERLHFGPFRLAGGRDALRDFFGATRSMGD